MLSRRALALSLLLLAAACGGAGETAAPTTTSAPDSSPGRSQADAGETTPVDLDQIPLPGVVTTSPAADPDESDVDSTPIPTTNAATASTGSDLPARRRSCRFGLSTSITVTPAAWR